MHEDLHEVLRQMRKRAKLTTKDVEVLTGIRRFTVYSWEREGCRPSPEGLGALLDAYNATAAERLMVWRLRSEPVAA